MDLSHDHHAPDHYTDDYILPLIPKHHSLKASYVHHPEDEALGNSSDTPVFSSDDAPASSENYIQHRFKQQRKGPWWVRHPEDHPWLVRTRRKRQFKRNMDSGVWMGSSDTGIEDECEVPDPVNSPPSAEALAVLASETWEDPEKFEGPVFPYWEDQPSNLGQYWRDQKAAAEQVEKSCRRGSEIVDLMCLGLTTIQDSILRPLQYLVITQNKSSTSLSNHQTFQPLIPNLQIFLANNQLSRMPDQLLQLQNLTVLSLRGNYLTEIPSSIGNLIHLRELNLSNNRLRWLPYELLDLLSTNLKTIMLHPNPFLRPQPRPFTTTAWTTTSPACATAPAYFGPCGSLIRTSQPSPCTTESHWPSPAPPAFLSPINNFVPSIQNPNNNPAPSLFELTLRSLSTHPQLPHLPFLLPPSAPPTFAPALQKAYHLKQAGGRKCTICRRPFIVARTEWVEWWQLSVRARKPVLRWDQARREVRFDPVLEAVVEGSGWFSGWLVPLVRRGCGWGCGPERKWASCPRVGWCQADEGELSGFY
ncbi:MAG: hypothetical protein LQ350_006049 [Teloschistes chrysophthalmus]|nr:MAG: hypothetical protein LQ350_006049 [Niorma chrysophthalma]